ncbi:MAG: hypothetical protein N3I86_00575 [Verrucomicrobiae bacterium]|nr:hypothetical protein [Verrucomicrobiae bacterium]MDW8310344.1 hypothetical protein [Verrucomicrobiales bacterium]
MTWFWKACRSGAVPILLCLATGCSGINMQQGVSPASLIVPGLMRAEPPATPPEAAHSPFQVAQTP